YAFIHVEWHSHRQLGFENDTFLGVEPIDEAVADGNAAQSAQYRQNQAFREQQPDQPETSSTQRQSHRDFPRSRTGPAKQQSRHVGARHQQHRQRQDYEDHAEFPIVIFDRARLELRVYRGATTARDGWIIALEALCHHGKFIPRLWGRRARLQPRLDVQFAVVAILEEILFDVGGKSSRHRERYVEIGMPEGQQAGEAVRSHTDHREWRAVQANGAAHDAGISCELVLPEIRAQHHHGIATGHLVFILAKAATQPRLNAKHLEKIAGN